MFGDADEEQLQELAQYTNARVFDGREDLTAAFRSVKGDVYKRQELTRRLEIFAAAQAECVVSVHMNQFSDPSQRGAQVFFQAGAEEGEVDVYKRQVFRPLKE